MKSIFKLYMFKLVILSLTMIFISFGAFSEETIYDCYEDKGILLFKVEVPARGNKKIYEKMDGIWKQMCTQKSSVIKDIGFKCFYLGNDRDRRGGGLDYFIFDQQFRTVTIHNDEGDKVGFNCKVKW